MAQLIPSKDISTIEQQSERIVAEALIRQLPENVIVYHSYELLEKQSGVLHEKEIDFIVLDPDYGMLLIEVKGGQNIRYDLEKGAWSRSDQIMKDPFVQARRNMHTLINRLTSRLGSIDFTYGYAVVFPNCVYFGALPANVSKEVLITSEDMNELSSKIQSAFHSWRRQAVAKISQHRIKALRGALEAEFHLIPLISIAIRNDEQEFVKLTIKQAELLNFLVNQKRALIEGVAGSGKTMLAFMQAKRFVDIYNCNHVLLVCYNKSLAESLTASLDEEYRNKITVRHFHGIVRDYIEKFSKLQFSPPSGEAENRDFWSIKAPDLFINACEHHGAPKFDGIIVDEGQDFEQFWYYALEKASVSTEIPFYIFFDPAQNLYVSNSQLPNFPNSYPLSTNCRNSKSIIRACNKLIGGEIQPMQGAPEGVPLEIHLCNSRNEIKDKLRLLLHQLIGTNTLKSSQIVILGPYVQTNSSIANITSFGDYQIVHDIKTWTQNKGVLYSTIRSFKGLEADIVLLIDFDSSQWNVSANQSLSVLSLNDFYVGASRAKHRLIVISRDSALRELLQR